MFELRIGDFPDQTAFLAKFAAGTAAVDDPKTKKLVS
jgi:hypothetical protein